MKITKYITVQENIDISTQQLCKYWKYRGMKFVELSETHLKGKRGNILGNMFSFNMKHLISKIEIKINYRQIECNLLVNTILQHILEADREFFELELETFEKYLLFDDLNEKAWIKLHRKSKKQSILYMVSIFAASFVSAMIISFLF